MTEIKKTDTSARHSRRNGSGSRGAASRVHSRLVPTLPTRPATGPGSRSWLVSLGAVAALLGFASAAVAQQSGVAVDPDGRATVVWCRNDGSTERVQARRIEPGGAVGPIKTFSVAGEDAVQPQVAVDPIGRATVVWTRHDGSNWRIQARRIRPDGTVGPIRWLSAAGESAVDPRVAVDPNGRAIVVWRRAQGDDRRVQARRIGPGGGVGRIMTLSAAGRRALDVDVAVDPNGRATVVWAHSNAPDFPWPGVRARRIHPDGTVGSIKTLTGPGVQTINPLRVAVDPEGHATAVWHTYVEDDPSAERVQARRIRPYGSLGPILTLSNTSGSGQALTVDPQGRSTVAWLTFCDGSLCFQTRRISRTGSVSPIQTIHSASGQTGWPEIAVGPAGRATMGWSEVLGGSGFSVRARRIDPGGGLGTIRTLSAAGQDARSEPLAVDSDGRSTSVWFGWDGTNWRVQSRRMGYGGNLGPIRWLSAAGQDVCPLFIFFFGAERDRALSDRNWALSRIVLESVN